MCALKLVYIFNELLSVLAKYVAILRNMKYKGVYVECI